MTRTVHTAAWWCWAAGMAAAGLVTTNLALCALLLFVIGVVARTAPRATANDPVAAFLRLALVVVAVKVLLQALFAPRVGGTEVMHLPELRLPDWAAGVRFGGAVTAEGLVAAARSGFQLAVVLVAFGAANALTNPMRLLRLMPAMLYELGVAASVALATAPQALATARALRDARRLRGRPTRGLRGAARTLVPTFELTLARSVELAASMDVRGFGRRTESRASSSRDRVAATSAATSIAVGVYGTFAPGTPRWLAVLAPVGALAALGLVATRRSTAVRTRYRPEPWTAASTAVAACGLAAAVGLWQAGVARPRVVEPDAVPLRWPELSVAAVASIGVGLIPAFLATGRS